jgi:hypothetical protein
LEQVTAVAAVVVAVVKLAVQVLEVPVSALARPMVSGSALASVRQ